MEQHLVIGLTGGVASGKSTVAKILGRRGLLVLDADDEARDVVRRPEVLASLVRRFGEQILDDDGALDRPALAAVAFASPEATADLNAIVHPEVRRRLLKTIDASGDRPVVLDVPLLVESPVSDRVTTWVFVETKEASREIRARERGWDAGERERREALQATLAEKRARADHRLENDGTMKDLERQVDALLERIGVTASTPQRPSSKRASS